jgi:glucose-1-phosphate adenylyltransferase
MKVTLVTTEVVDDDPSRFGVVVADDDGSISDYAYKPDDPKSSTVATEVFAFHPTALLDRLEHLADALGDDDDESGLEDLGDDVLPWMVEQQSAAAFRLPGYWRDLGTIEAYWRAHMELLNDPPDIELGGTQWPVRTVATQRPPARVHSSAAIEDALLSPGCSVHGAVTRSVLGPGVVVAEGAVVNDSVLLADCLVEGGATVERSIVDAQVRVGRNARVGSSTAGETEDGLVVIGMEAIIEGGSKVGPGSHVDPG